MLHKISRKLRSRSGASMLIAMLFMMFCMFIGSTVLAASTANSYRVAHLSDQQQYLNERSAALLISDQLKPQNNGLLQLTAAEITVVKQYGTVGNGGVWIPNTAVEPTTEKILSFVATHSQPLTAMQRLALESAALKYKEAHYPSGTPLPTITVAGFTFGTETAPAALTDLWTASHQGEIKVSGTSTEHSQDFANFSATYSCSEDFDILVDFGTSSQITVDMPGMASTTAPITQTYYASDTDGTYLATSTQQRTVIIWDDPVIEKGDVA